MPDKYCFRQPVCSILCELIFEKAYVEKYQNQDSLDWRKIWHLGFNFDTLELSKLSLLNISDFKSFKLSDFSDKRLTSRISSYSMTSTAGHGLTWTVILIDSLDRGNANGQYGRRLGQKF